MNTCLILLFLTFLVGEFTTLGLKCRICQEAFIEESCNEYPELQMHGCKVVNIYFLPNKLSGTKKAKLPDFVKVYRIIISQNCQISYTFFEYPLQKKVRGPFSVPYTIFLKSKFHCN